jgi:hypothetical protein
LRFVRVDNVEISLERKWEKENEEEEKQGYKCLLIYD